MGWKPVGGQVSGCLTSSPRSFASPQLLSISVMPLEGILLADLGHARPLTTHGPLSAVGPKQGTLERLKSEGMLASDSCHVDITLGPKHPNAHPEPHILSLPHSLLRLSPQEPTDHPIPQPQPQWPIEDGTRRAHNSTERTSSGLVQTRNHLKLITE